MPVCWCLRTRRLRGLQGLPEVHVGLVGHIARPGFLRGRAGCYLGSSFAAFLGSGCGGRGGHAGGGNGGASAARLGGGWRLRVAAETSLVGLLSCTCGVLRLRALRLGTSAHRPLRLPGGPGGVRAGGGDPDLLGEGALLACQVIDHPFRLFPDADGGNDCLDPIELARAVILHVRTDLVDCRGRDLASHRHSSVCGVCKVGGVCRARIRT
mmetsp:Transcript_10801/g.26951  ORF Transcript_10801/g.26951 Transcript_10801/m.26951 type:complete len:211 (-) Transcript_10801:31-663(-)